MIYYEVTIYAGLSENYSVARFPTKELAEEWYKKQREDGNRILSGIKEVDTESPDFFKVDMDWQLNWERKGRGNSARPKWSIPKCTKVITKLK